MKIYTMRELIENEIGRLEKLKEKLQKKIKKYEESPTKLFDLYREFNAMPNELRIKNIKSLAKREKDIQEDIKYRGNIEEDYDKIAEIDFAVKDWKTELFYKKMRSQERNKV